MLWSAKKWLNTRCATRVESKEFQHDSNSNGGAKDYQLHSDGPQGIHTKEGGCE
jgi:hypothetical protein